MKTAISEAELLEIEQRFRAIEDRWEDADVEFAVMIEHHEERADAADADLSKPGKYEAACRRINHAKERVEQLTRIREGMERSLNAAREDMERMQEALRR